MALQICEIHLPLPIDGQTVIYAREPNVQVLGIPGMLNDPRNPIAPPQFAGFCGYKTVISDARALDGKRLGDIQFHGNHIVRVIRDPGIFSGEANGTAKIITMK